MTATPSCIIYFLPVPCVKEALSRGTIYSALVKMPFNDPVCLLAGKLIARTAVLNMLGSERNSTQNGKGEVR